MSDGQIGASVALAVIGLLLIVISACARDGELSNPSSFGEHMSRAGLFLGGFFMMPLVVIDRKSVV